MKRKLFEVKIIVNSLGDHSKLGDDDLEEISDIINEVVVDSADHINDIIQDLGAEKGVELEVVVKDEQIEKGDKLNAEEI